MRRPDPTQPARRGHLVSAHTSRIGEERETNEDAMLDEPELGLYAVFDGMGGSNAGEIASRIARTTTLGCARRHPADDPTGLLRVAVTQAHAAIRDAARTEPRWRGMGTTAVLCSIRDPQRAHVAHVGDSRAYLLRGGGLHALTRDHSVTQALIDRGELTPAEARVHPRRNALYRSLGVDGEVTPDGTSLSILPGDRLLLCSDGLSNYVQDEAIADVLSRAADLPRGLDELVKRALRNGGGDDITIVVIERRL